MADPGFYVVFEGWKPGVYESWEDCEIQIGEHVRSKYLKYDSLKEAQQAFREGLPAFYRKRNQTVRLEEGTLSTITQMIMNSASQNRVPVYPVHTALCVYVRVNDWTKKVKYVYDWINRGETENLYRFTRDCPKTRISQNLAEFDALVQGLIILKECKQQFPIYTESDVAMAWEAKKGDKFVMTGGDKILVEINPVLREVFGRRFGWLFHNQKHNKVLKWHRQHWGESPAAQHPWQIQIDEEDMVFNADDGEWMN